MLRSLPFLFLCLLGIVICLEPWMPMLLKSGLVALSFTIKTGLMTVLPLIIFCLMFKVAVQLTHHASKMLLGLALMVCCSNFVTTWLSHYVGMGLSFCHISILFPDAANTLLPLWELKLPSFVKNEHALIAGLLLGLLCGYGKPLIAEQIAQILEKITEKLLKSLSLVMPFFIMGFVIKMQAEGTLKHIIHDYALIFVVIAVAQYTYIFFIYFLSTLQWRAFCQAIKNMLPAAIAGFSTMSSAAAMPLTLIATERNVKNRDLARAIIPATVNNHLMGDCFAIPILAFAILTSFNLSVPSEINYLIFTGYFVIAKFSVAAVPGGGILVMLPILEKYMGFDPIMLSLITALYILFDPIITSANVMGNGGFAMMFDKLAASFGRRASLTQEN